MSIKQQMIEALKHSIEKTEADILEYSKPCNSKVTQGRTAHREWLKKKSEKDEITVKGVGR